MALRIYNTMTRRKEPFETLEPGKVRMYVCGPTVYGKAHVGHAMSSVVFDIIRRYLEYRGYEVLHVMNYTDVDDKVIERANKMNVDPLQLAEQHIQEYCRHLDDLNILQATVNPRATEEMELIVKMIRDLEEKGYAYESGGDVYFRVTKDDDYGKLSGRRLEDMQAGARIEVGEKKEHPMDFTLWKAAKPGEPAWDSPWGPGRPGWHIECSAMNLEHLGEQIDIHGGGNDLIFPHHENEIAQTESITEKPFSRYWVHNGMLHLSGSDKMSRSIGNLITIDEFLSTHEGDALRMLVLNSSYRGPVTFNEDVIAQAERALERLRSAMKPALPTASETPAEVQAALHKQEEATKREFQEAMDDDFNTAGALAQLFDLVRAINQARDAGATEADIASAQAVLVELARVLGLRMQPPDRGAQQAAPFVDLLLDIRQELRQRKLWDLSDQIRDSLAEMGVVLEDTREGTTWHWK